ncbi:SCO-spondin-like isoform X2 [Ruditapes philippinarum]|nr:SCO-spondin-like isoform X2 [Ruditapes philippinarum]
MFEVWNKLYIYSTILIVSCHVAVSLNCYCTTHDNVNPVFRNNFIPAKEVLIENKCFKGSIHGDLFCPENLPLCLPLENLQACDDSAFSETGKKIDNDADTLLPGTTHGYAYEKRFLISDTYWGSWSTWEDCQVASCNVSGFRSRHRECLPKLTQEQCIGEPLQFEHCTETCTDQTVFNPTWGSWFPWDECLATQCGLAGVRKRKRVCLHSTAPEDCSGFDTELDSCFKYCKVDSVWSEWGPWATCSNYTTGFTRRLRQCEPPPEKGGTVCPGGKSWDIISCADLSGWTSWEAWSICYTTSGIDIKLRSRICTTGPCPGKKVDATLCNEPPVYSDWGTWGACSVTCGEGDQTRQRNCIVVNTANSNTSADSLSCAGNSSESRKCMTPSCADSSLAFWSEWSSWDLCQPPCDTSITTRNRTCNGAGVCSGPSSENMTCTQSICNVDGGWTSWEEWSNCVSGLKYNITVRFRNCSKPKPKNSGKDCYGRFYDIEACKKESSWGSWNNVGPCLKTVDANGSNSNLQYRNRTCLKGYANTDCLGESNTREPCTLTGVWEIWGNWSACSITCGEGVKTRQRTCMSGDVRECEGNDTDTSTCSDALNCPIDGMFSVWSAWDTCPVSCGGSAKTRNRYCNSPGPSYGGRDCVGEYSEAQVCNTQDCPRDGHWTDWSSWDPCSVTCGNGTKERTRTCSNPAPSNGGADCVGTNKNNDGCNEAVCDVDGEWSQWQEWAECTCQKTRRRKRDCDNPTPVANGAYCIGSATETGPCVPDTNLLVCPVNGGWNTWLEWSYRCSVTCGNGVVHRYRQCLNPKPIHGGAYCGGETSQAKACLKPECPIDGEWSSWSAWTHCDVTCENGTQYRNRTCNNPKPEFGGADCQGGTDESRICTLNPCPIDGNWSAWLEWSSWDVTCANGSRTRTRKCDNPAPQNGGQNCPGDFNKHESQDLGNCPVNGSWTDWTAWTKCSVSCENGTQSRTRTCSNPTPMYGGENCTGVDNESQFCSERPSCIIDGGWSEWSSWFGCNATCGVGSNIRYRACSNPIPQNHGKPCKGRFADIATCNEAECPVDGNWADWQAWGSCSVTCSHGINQRTRTCSNPLPKGGGKQCAGNFTESGDCYEGECPVDGEWTEWAVWTTCSATCGIGYKFRNRSCNNPAPQYGGVNCSGNYDDNSTCSITHCPIDGQWGSWHEWSDCSTTCGSGFKLRNRTCDNPPKFGGANCSGMTTESDTCLKELCPAPGGWGPWQPWSPCLGSCTAANKQRFRNCDHPAPVNGGDYCAGKPIESQSCRPTGCKRAALFKCYQCDIDHQGTLCTKIKQTDCHEPYCVNELTSLADGTRIIDRRCGTQHECDTNWWAHTRNREECMLNDVNRTLTSDRRCTFCCVNELCNADVIPPADTLYEPLP